MYVPEIPKTYRRNHLLKVWFERTHPWKWNISPQNHSNWKVKSSSIQLFFCWVPWKDLPKKCTLLGTNISPKNGILKMIFLFPRWDMLIPWRVIPSTFFQVKQVTFFQSRPQEVDWAHVVSIFSGRLRGEVTTEDLGVEPPVFAAAPQWGGQTTWLLRLLNHLLSLGNCDSSSVFLIIWVDFFFYPRRSRYGIYTYTHHKVDLNVGEYSIHSSHMVMTAWRWRRLLLVWCGDCLCCTRLSAGQARVWWWLFQIDSKWKLKDWHWKWWEIYGLGGKQWKNHGFQGGESDGKLMNFNGI